MRALAILAAGVVLTAAGLVSAPAHAQPFGIMTNVEFQDICTQDLIDQFGHVLCTRTAHRSEVEGPKLCSCTGDVTGRWTGSGGAENKTVYYYGPGTISVFVNYRLLKGYWEAQTKIWRQSS